jgi:FMN-dependent oxidoreductase (nitrilotriacetate monooxygenase family)
MTQSKRQKLNKPKKTLIINAAGNGAAGNWRHPTDRSAELGHSIDAWIEYAKLAEKGKLNALFVADHLALFTGYKGLDNFEEPARSGLNIARIEPGALVTALSTHTKNIGFGLTFSTISEHPYHFARRLAVLDTLSKGRVGWNIVSSYLHSTGRQLLEGKLPEHDERYVKTEEYLDVVYKLLLSSWRDDALVIDRERDVFVDPERIREINHEGKYFKVPGPALYENTPQGFPLIIQAGSSAKGNLFAAENAEVVFVNSHDPPRIGKSIAEVKRLAKEKFNRDPNHIKFLVPANVILGKTHEDAIAKEKEYEKYHSTESVAASFSAVTGIDLSKFELDDIVQTGKKSNQMQSATDSLINKGEKPQTKREILQNYNKYGFFGKPFIGTAKEVADQLEEWVDEYDVDGFNIGFGAVWPDNLQDIVDLLIPELQDRGLFWKDYPVPGGTFRENVFGVKGQSFLHEDHPAHGLRWTDDKTKEEFNDYLKSYEKKILSRRGVDLKKANSSY